MSFLAEPRTRTWILLLVLATIVVYVPAIEGTWVWDDHEVLDGNTRLFEPWRYLTQETYTALTDHGGDLYRPLCYLTYLVDQSILPGALSAKIGNLALHLGAAVLVGRIARTLGAPDVWALLGAAVFALHPASSEPVAYGCCRHILVPTVLALAAVLAYLRGRDLSAGLLAFAAPFANEAWVLIAPFLLFWMLGNRRIAWSTLALATLGALAYVGVRTAIGVTFLDEGPPIPTGLLPAIGGFAIRGLVLFSIPDTADVLPTLFPDAPAGIAVVVVAIVACALVWGRTVVAAFLAPCTIMLPCAMVSANNGIVADRYFYVGMASAVGIGGALVGARLFRGASRTLLAMLAFYPLVLAMGTWLRAWDWADDITLFSASLRHGYPRAGFYLGSYWQGRGDCDAAVPYYRLAFPWDPRAADNLQACLIELGELDEALALVPTVTGPTAWHQGPFLNTARAYVRRNDLERARTYVVEATTRFPDDPRGWVMLGNIDGMRGDLDGAGRAFERALVLRPGDREAAAGMALVEKARAGPAVEEPPD